MKTEREENCKGEERERQRERERGIKRREKRYKEK